MAPWSLLAKARWGPATLPLTHLWRHPMWAPSLLQSMKQLLPSPSRRRRRWLGSWRGPGTHTWVSCCHPPHTPCRACSGGSGRGLAEGREQSQILPHPHLPQDAWGISVQREDRDFNRDSLKHLSLHWEDRRVSRNPHLGPFCGHTAQ